MSNIDAAPDVLELTSDPESLNFMSLTVAYNKPVIQDFIDNLTPQDALTVAAWLVGLFDTQDPGLAAAFDEARVVGRDLAKVMLDDYRRNSKPELLAGDANNLIVLFPQARPISNVTPPNIDSKPLSNLVV